MEYFPVDRLVIINQPFSVAFMVISSDILFAGYLHHLHKTLTVRWICFADASLFLAVYLSTVQDR